MAGWGALGGALYKNFSNAPYVWKETPTYIVKFFGGTILTVDATPALLGVGYIIGPRICSFMFSGGVLAWWVLIPLIKMFAVGKVAIYPSTIPISQMAADDIWNHYVRYICAGTLAIGGILSLLKVLPLIYRTVHVSFKELFKGFKARAHLQRTDRDISLSW